MAPFLGLNTINFVPLLLLMIGLIHTYRHVVILVEGRVDVLLKEEESELQRKLTILNKPHIQTIYAPWGDTYDCIEFHKQPAFDNPLLKNYTFKMGENHIVSTRSSQLEKLLNQVDECPKGTVPIRRTTREDLIRAKSLSSNGNPDKQYRAGISYRAQKTGETLYGAKGWFNFWNPSVNQDQFSSTEIALYAGSGEETNVLKHGWRVDPQLYGGSNLTRTFAYWTGGSGKKEGCYNTLCSGFVQVHDKYTLDMPIYKSSTVGGLQYTQVTFISLEFGKWWLTIHEDIQIGYWPSELFPAFAPGAGWIYWGGRVKAGKDGVSPPMGSGQQMDDHAYHNGYIEQVQYVDMTSNPQRPETIEYTIDCFEHYNARYYQKNDIVHFGGTGGGNCQ
ncbi:hypothetical protein MKW98_026431 [Papaver atlanticum]|uniref:Neprosin PEP catalytic domain-containing protein n=1 Tax=Papaver atlanticum TaxID=357466 RepID=A0AAD4TA69_9MAGN|nr:hypothetical protein MKW98_026431 [Papaver atlanticum]